MDEIPPCGGRSQTVIDFTVASRNRTIVRLPLVRIVIQPPGSSARTYPRTYPARSFGVSPTPVGAGFIITISCGTHSVYSIVIAASAPISQTTEALSFACQHFGQWPSTSPASKPKPIAASAYGTGVKNVESPNVPASTHPSAFRDSGWNPGNQPFTRRNTVHPSNRAVRIGKLESRPEITALVSPAYCR